MIRRSIHIISFLLLCCIISSTQQAHAQNTANKEYRVKAVFMYNFIQFVDWPSNAFSSETSPFIIGILGDDPFGQFIDETVSGEKMGKHPVVVQRYKDIREMKNCHLLFINTADAEHAKEYISALGNKSTLTVSDNPAFAKMGGMIRFMTSENKIRLQINVEAAKSADLFISSKLLRLSDIYDPNKQEQ